MSMTAPVAKLMQRVWGKLFGDKGYMSRPLTEQLRQRGISLITKRTLDFVDLLF